MINKIVCLGDSITYGYGAYPEDAWPRIAQVLTGIPMVNCGVNGDTAAGMLWRFYEDVALKKPEVCILMAGANDLLEGRTAGETAETIADIVKKSRSFGILPVIAVPVNIDADQIRGMWPCARDPEAVEQEFYLLAQNLLKMERDDGSLTVWNIQEKYREQMRIHRPSGSWYQDGVHPTREGYQILGRIFAKFITSCGWSGPTGPGSIKT